MDGFTREQFWTLADDVFGSACATAVRDVEAVIRGCGATGLVMRVGSRGPCGSWPLRACLPGVRVFDDGAWRP
ncbi:hypothetical protein ACFWNG_18365 [Streptomyces sp. NPDC058391]|uniref:hypothetical protein n=1 Tax=Streptomyces sp. NPDC058391 TaxID=3346476 RepID=UPI003669EBEC